MSWSQANQNLIAKALGELSYEQILKPVHLAENNYEISFQSGARYTFNAWMGIWDHLRVTPSSVKKNGSDKVLAGEFFLDAQTELEMCDIILGNFVEEMHNSLYSDVMLLEKQKNVTAKMMSYWSGEKVQSYLNGHPKILLSKGRVGWGASELFEYAPESERSVCLFWVAVKKSNLNAAFDDNFSMRKLLSESLDRNEEQRFSELLNEKNIKLDEFYYLPVHPWQWDRFIKIQFFADLASGEMIELGIFGDEYLPQISIRTLSNISRPEKCDIKLPLTILNTSAIRGIPARYISVGTKLSHYMMDLCKQDEVLGNTQTDILMERAGISFEHKIFSKIKAAPYRYKEYLGAIWRESTCSKLAENELAILTGSLFFQDNENNSLIGAYIEKSGLTKEAWIKDYFKVVIIPLYHLQVKYGIGLVSHGQNIVLRLKDYKPVGVILKDFQGDLRLSTESILLGKEDFSEIAAKLDKMPPHYLIHDLITGHLVTTLRFVSEVMQESVGMEEIEFYGILASVVKEYTDGREIPAELNLLNKTINRVLVNKVRFKAGYGDSSERLLPAVGLDLINPIYLGLKHVEVTNG